MTLTKEKRVPFYKECSTCPSKNLNGRDKSGRFIKGSEGHKGFKHTKEIRIKISNEFKGRHFSKRTEFKKGMIPWNKGLKGVQDGKNNGRWKGGKAKHSSGYILLKSQNHPFKNNHGYVLAHRLVMEKHLGRYLLPVEVVHHINNNKKDNRIENLMLLKNNKEHMKYHRGRKNVKKNKKN